MTILVTGASGFLGRRVLARLAGQPLRLLVLPGDPQVVILVGSEKAPRSVPAASDWVV